jgi:hypothetical protein
MGVMLAATERRLKPPSGMEQQEGTPRTTFHLIGGGGLPGSGFVDQHLCNHINTMEDLVDSKGLVAVNSDYIKQNQVHGDSDFVCIDTEGGVLLVGAPALKATSRSSVLLLPKIRCLLLACSPSPPQVERGPRRKRNCGGPWSGSSQGALRAGHSTSTSLVVGIWKANFLAPT